MVRKRRIRLKGPIRALFVSGGANGSGQVHNVSLGGLFVRSTLLLPSGAPIDAALTPPSGRKVSIHGVVRWNTATVGHGFETAGFGVAITRASHEFVSFVDGALAATGPEAR
jgi:hypothetical protein